MWKKTLVFRGRYNMYGGRQYVVDYENEEKELSLEIGSYTTSKGFKYADVFVSDWKAVHGERKEFETYKEALKYAKDYMKKH